MTTETLKNILLRINAIEIATGVIKNAIKEELYERSGEQEKTSKEVRYIRDDPFDCSNESAEVSPEDESDSNEPSPEDIAHSKYLELCDNYPLFKFIREPGAEMVNTLYDFFKMYKVTTCPSNCCGNERSASNFILNGVNPEGINVCMCADFQRDITDKVYINITVSGSNNLIKWTSVIGDIAEASQHIAFEHVLPADNWDALHCKFDNVRMWKIDQNNNGMTLTYAISIDWDALRRKTDEFTDNAIMHYRCAFIVEFFRTLCRAIIPCNIAKYFSAPEKGNPHTKCPVRKCKRKDF